MHSDERCPPPAGGGTIFPAFLRGKSGWWRGAAIVRNQVRKMKVSLKKVIFSNKPTGYRTGSPPPSVTAFGRATFLQQEEDILCPVSVYVHPGVLQCCSGSPPHPSRATPGPPSPAGEGLPLKRSGCTFIRGGCHTSAAALVRNDAANHYPAKFLFIKNSPSVVF